VPDGTPQEAALKRTTHLCVSAHQDDIEIMAYHGIAECFGLPDRWFSGVVVTNGAGSPRSGIYGHYTDDEMQSIRRQEQRTAAYVGGYACMLQLGYPSSAVKDPKSETVIADLLAIFQAAKPEVVYLTTSPTSTRPTSAPAARAGRAAPLPPQDRPKKIYGCEVWRDLDWLSDDVKQCLPASKYPNIAARSWASSTRR